ncbi:MAG: CRTAC1 family protein [Bacteroidia bacterium]
MLLSIKTQSQSFTDVTESSGINHQFRVYEGMFGGGACVFDYNNDGFEDLYLTSGMNEDVLYKNNGNGTFTNVYEGSGLERTRSFVTQGVVGADVNKDGWVDLFITTITTKDSVKKIPRAINLFFLNNGDGTFRDVTTEYGLDQMNSFSTGANWGDVNLDGYPDLYVGNYFLNYEGELTMITDATIVGANQTAKGYFLINEKGKSFSDAYKKYGFNHRGFGFGGVFTDYDNDYDLDLLVNHDFGYKAVPSYLFENEYPEKSFKDVSEAFEMDLKINAMGAAVGDFDQDGDMDYFITNIRFNRFMVNEGPDKPFVDKAKELGTSFVSISWGANFADFDHDGDLDLFVSNGDLNPNCVPMADYYFENQGGKFQEKAMAIGVNDYGIGRGSVIFDIENDGDMDILVVNQKPTLDYPVESMTTLYRNDSTVGNWLKVALKGNQSDKHGIGSRVELWNGGKKWIREIDGGGSSHISQNSVIAHFGVGEAEKVDSVVVIWTGGKRQVVKEQAVNTLVEMVEIESAPSGGTNWKQLLIMAGLIILGYGVFRFLKK